MDIRLRIVIIAVVILFIIILLSFKFLSKRGRYILYTLILVTAVGTFIYVNRNLNPSAAYALEPYASSLPSPVQAIWGPDGSERFFIIGKTGLVHIFEDGELQQPPFLDIEHLVASDGGEQGLLSVVFDPDFETSGIFYVYYTNLDNDSTLVRYQVAAEDPTVVDLDSAQELLTIPQIDTHHNGGTLLFGPDGYLYLSVGNGGDKEMNANSVSQDLTNYLGTILRLDVSEPDELYHIPPDNPFINDETALPEIWAYGLRNPWRMAFDSETGDLYIADVGEGNREEVNYQPNGEGAGANYGWPWFEGSANTESDGRDTINKDDFVFPLTDYDHLALGGCSIIGGEVYRGQELPELNGKYLYGDFCSGFVWAVDSTNGKVETVLRDQTVRQSSFAVDGSGELYLLDVANGNMFKIMRN